MSLEKTAILVRTSHSNSGWLTSFAGVAYRKTSGEIATQLFQADDTNISLPLQHLSNGRELVYTLHLVYVGPFLDQVIKIGKADFQIFRLHWSVYHDFVDRDDYLHFGELLGERQLTHSRVLCHFEPIWGPRWADEAFLKAWAVYDVFKPDKVFVRCPVPVAETIEEYQRHKTPHNHPGVVMGTSDEELMRMMLYMQGQQHQVTNPKVM